MKEARNNENVKALSPIWLNEKKCDLNEMKNKRIKRYMKNVLKMSLKRNAK